MANNKKTIAYYQVEANGDIGKLAPTVAKRVRQFWLFVKRMARESAEACIVRMELMIVWGDIVRRRKFFEGAVVKYYAIQSLGRMPSNDEMRKWRITILDEMLGYSYLRPKGLKGAGENKKDRVSTTAFNEQEWDDFFELTDAVLFAPSGYMFPSRAVYADMVADVKDGGKGMSVEQATEALCKMVLKNVIKLV